MAADQDPEVRGQAVLAIQRCRQQPQEEVRPYRLPAMNFSADSLTELVDWQTELVTEPPLTMALSDEEVTAIQSAPLEVAAYPVHTVAVERTVKAVTEAAAAVVGEERRHGFICSRLRHRQLLPNIVSKRSWFGVGQ